MSDYDAQEQQRQYREIMQQIEAQNRQRDQELKVQYELLKSQLNGR